MNFKYINLLVHIVYFLIARDNEDRMRLVVILMQIESMWNKIRYFFGFLSETEN